jgi:hypothetical protein
MRFVWRRSEWHCDLLAARMALRFVWWREWHCDLLAARMALRFAGRANGIAICLAARAALFVAPKARYMIARGKREARRPWSNIPKPSARPERPKYMPPIFRPFQD